MAQRGRPGTFASEYEQWFYEDGKQNGQLEKTLQSTYGNAWLLGAREDQFAILSFIYEQRNPIGFVLVVEALNGDDEGLAAHAASITLSLIAKGYDLDGAKAALDHFVGQFPKWTIFRQAYLEELEDRL